MRAVYASLNEELYTLNVRCLADIADRVGEPQIDALTSSDGQFDFWMTPMMRGVDQQPNRAATELLLAVSDFNAAEVPMLRGYVVVTSHDPAGELAGLTDEQISHLTAVFHRLGRRDRWVLNRRFARARRDLQRRWKAEEAAAARARWDALFRGLT
jgi:hypothetical protein